MTLKDQSPYGGILENEQFNEEDLSFFSFRESMKARWKELKHSYVLLRKSPLFFLGFFIIASLVFLAIFAPQIAPYKCSNLQTCQQSIDSINHKIDSGLPPGTIDNRISAIVWGNFVSEGSQFPDLQGAGNLSVAQVPGSSSNYTNMFLIGTSNGKMFMFSYNYTQSTGAMKFTQITNATYPLPAVPAGLTTVLPAVGDLNNDSLNDIVLGGNTGEIYVNLNIGNSTMPKWGPWITLTNKFTGQPIKLSGTTAPYLMDWDRTHNPYFNGGMDIIISNSGNKSLSYFIQRPAAYANWNLGKVQSNFVYDDQGHQYDFNTTWDITYNHTLYFQPLKTPQIYEIGGQIPFNLSTLAGSGVMKLHFAYMDPSANNSLDMLINFDSGQSYIFILGGTTYQHFVIPLTTNVTSAKFALPPLMEHVPGSDLIIQDFTNDTLVDMLVFSPNGNVTFAPQIAKIDGRMHWLGTDNLGYDIFSKILYALQYDLILAIGIEGFTVIIGVIIGSISGYFGGFIDTLFMRITDIFFAFPDLILAMAFISVLGANMTNIALALILVDWAGTSRLMRGQVLSEKTHLYVESARASGLGNFRIIFRHVLPNSIYPIIVTATLGLGGVILSMAGLSFLGYGPIEGSAELGRMVVDGRGFIQTAPWEIFFPGLVIMVIVLSFNLLGDALRDILDPRLRR